MYYVSWVQMIDERWYLQLDLGSKFTIVSLVCLIMTLYTSLYLDNCWGQLLSLLERLNTHDNFCDKNIKHIVYNVQDYSVVFMIVLFPGCVWGLVFYSYLENTAWPHHFIEKWFGPIKLVQPRDMLLKCLKQERKVSGAIFVLWDIDFVT